MSGFTRAGDIAHTVEIPIKIGDVWIDRKHHDAPYPTGRVCIVDRYPFDETVPATKVAIEWLASAERERRLDVAEFRRRFVFRKAAV